MAFSTPTSDQVTAANQTTTQQQAAAQAAAEAARISPTGYFDPVTWKPIADASDLKDHPDWQQYGTFQHLYDEYGLSPYYTYSANPAGASYGTTLSPLSTLPSSDDYYKTTSNGYMGAGVGDALQTIGSKYGINPNQWNDAYNTYLSNTGLNPYDLGTASAGQSGRMVPQGWWGPTADLKAYLQGMGMVDPQYSNLANQYVDYDQERQQQYQVGEMGTKIQNNGTTFWDDLPSIIAGMSFVLSGPAYASALGAMGAGGAGLSSFSVGDALTALAKKIGMKAAMSALSGQGSKNLISPSMLANSAAAGFADGGLVGDDIDLSWLNDLMDSTSNWDLGGVGDLGNTAIDYASSLDPSMNSLGMGLMDSGTPMDEFGNPIDNTGIGAYLKPSQSIFDKLGYTKDGDINWSNVLKSAGSGLGILAALQNSRKLNTQGAQTASSMLQPARYFTVGPGLSSVSSFGRGKERALPFAHGGALGAAAAGPQRAHGYLDGDTGGQDDTVPAKLSHGEYVFDADTVSSLGDGNNAAGAKKLDEFRMKLRKHKRAAPATKIPPKSRNPEDYMG